MSHPSFFGEFPRGPVVFSRLPLHLLVSGWFGFILWSVSLTTHTKIKSINFRPFARTLLCYFSAGSYFLCSILQWQKQWFNHGKVLHFLHVSVFKLIKLTSTTFVFTLMLWNVFPSTSFWKLQHFFILDNWSNHYSTHWSQLNQAGQLNGQLSEEDGPQPV